MDMKIIRLEDSQSYIFKKIVDWNYNWWGIRNHKSYEEVECNLKHSLCGESRLPQTYVALIDNIPVGMYQLSMCDDLESRPDIYPWLINVYVDKHYRGMNICKELMNTVKDNARRAGLSELYLYTKHICLYEKYGWVYVEDVLTFREESPIERLYRLDINEIRSKRNMKMY